MTQAAVLTGDLIGSTEAGPEAVERAIQTLRAATNEFGRLGNVSRPLKFRFAHYRGDGWQAAVHWAGLSFRLATYLLAQLRASDLGLRTRIGIGIGSIDSWGSTDLASAHGTAFINSGHALDSLGTSSSLAVSSTKNDDLHWIVAALETLAYLSDRWSLEQAQAISFWATHQTPFADRNSTLLELADNLNISRQALSSRLAVAGEKPIMAAIRAAEATL